MKVNLISTKPRDYVCKTLAYENATKILGRVTHHAGVVGHKIDITDQSIVHQLARYQINNPDNAGNESIFAVPSMGALGCFLAHVGCWRECAYSNTPMVVIEEDFVIPLQKHDILTTALANVPKNASFVSLAYIRAGQTFNFNGSFDRMLGPGWGGTQCYWIAPAGAALLLQQALPIWTQVDLFIGIQAYLQGEFNAYVLKERLYPLINVVVDNAFSQVQSFAVKKYMPRSNWFYIVIVTILILYLICDFAWRFK